MKLVLFATLLLFAGPVSAQAQQNQTQQKQTQNMQEARALLARAVQTELAADRSDHTAYSYRDHDVTPDHDTLTQVMETPQGAVKRVLEDHGHSLTEEARRADDAQTQLYLTNQDLQAKRRKDEAHDDDQAEQMLKLLPDAFLWSVQAETPETVTLDFKPDPAYHPANMEARVFAVMAGRVVVTRGANRIRTIEGKLTSDVKIAFGLFGKLQQGGTFHVERREVVAGHWQVVSTEVHISGHVFFKTIGSQEDETRSNFRVSTAQTLRQAYGELDSLSH